MSTPRRFQLHRDHDVTGASGTGIVADGVHWPDGTAAVRWRGPRASAVHWDSIEDAEAIHGHGGHTRLVWLDTESESENTALVVPDSPKMLRETLCVAAARISNSPLDAGRRDEHVARLGRLVGECDRHRPLGPDGKHGERHTATCGCEDTARDDQRARCIECGSTRVAYRNYRDQPFCWPCADGQPHPVDPMGATNE